jgi:hypothetical protein
MGRGLQVDVIFLAVLLRAALAGAAPVREAQEPRALAVTLRAEQASTRVREELRVSRSALRVQDAIPALDGTRAQQGPRASPDVVRCATRSLHELRGDELPAQGAIPSPDGQSWLDGIPVHAVWSELRVSRAATPASGERVFLREAQASDALHARLG